MYYYCFLALVHKYNVILIENEMNFAIIPQKFSYYTWSSYLMFSHIFFVIFFLAITCPSLILIYCSIL
jgi:hypothetical protein